MCIMHHAANELPITIEEGEPLTLLRINSSPTVCNYCMFITILNDTRNLFFLSISNLRLTQGVIQACDFTISVGTFPYLYT